MNQTPQNASTANSTTRPRRSDNNIIAQAAKNLAPKVKEWIGEENTDLALIESDLTQALRYNDDGYELARSLDRHGYTPDAALVEILDEAGWVKGQALRMAEKAWVTGQGLQSPPLETRVTWAKKTHAGVGIVTFNHPDGKSTVMFPALGHVREGIGSNGYIVNWEELQEASDPKGADSVPDAQPALTSASGASSPQSSVGGGATG